MGIIGEQDLGLVEIGDGLKAPLSEAEGRERLGAYATPMTELGRPLAGAAQLQRQYGIARSTL